MVTAAPDSPDTANPVTLEPGPIGPGLKQCLGPEQVGNAGEVDT